MAYAPTSIARGSAVEHVVFFTGADGAALFRRMPSLEEAVRFVEHLRNVEGVEDSRVFGMTEVPLQFKTVYRVEIPGQSDALPPLPPMPAMPAELDAVAAEASEPSDGSAEANAAGAEMAAVPGETFSPVEPEPVSNGRSARGTGFFSR
jgi:hypothetical protein